MYVKQYYYADLDYHHLGHYKFFHCSQNRNQLRLPPSEQFPHSNEIEKTLQIKLYEVVFQSHYSAVYKM
jgi:hypothetical protein